MQASLLSADRPLFDNHFRQRAVQLKKIADDLNTKGEDTASPSLFDQEEAGQFEPEKIEEDLRKDVQTLEEQMKDRWNFFDAPFFSSQDINI